MKLVELNQNEMMEFDGGRKKNLNSAKKYVKRAISPGRKHIRSQVNSLIRHFKFEGFRIATFNGLGLLLFK